MTDQDPLVGEPLEAQVRTLFEGMNALDADAAASVLTDDVVWQQPGLPGPLVGRTATANTLRDLFRAFPDLAIPLDDVVIYHGPDGTRAASHWRVIGTMTGPLDPPGFAPTGRRCEVHGVCLYEFRDGRIARHTMIYDALDMLTQLGLMPGPDSLQSKAMVRLQRLTAKLRRRR